MKIFFAALVCLYSFSASAETVQEAFREFYTAPEISGNHCGQNVRHFLNYLNKREVKYRSGFVVSIYDDYGFLHHFDARWGDEEKYLNCETYLHQNWFFHVFAVIDGMAYDFSQSGPKVQPLHEYLKTAYLPASATEKLPFHGVLKPETSFEEQFNRKMQIFKIEDYRKSYGAAAYEGTFIELFAFSQGKRMRSDASMTRENYKAVDDGRTTSRSGGVTISNPRLQVPAGELPLQADPIDICRAFGFFGSVSSELKFKVSDGQRMLRIYSSLRDAVPWPAADDIRISYQERTTSGSTPHIPSSHFATSVTCSDLQSIMKGM